MNINSSCMDAAGAMLKRDRGPWSGGLAKVQASLMPPEFHQHSDFWDCMPWRMWDGTPQQLLAHDIIDACAALDDSSLLHIDFDVASLRRPSTYGAHTSHL